LNMRIKQPTAVRERLMKEKRWLTINEIAHGLGMSNHTVSRAMRGLPVRIGSIMKIAGAIDAAAADIATFT